MKVFTSAIVSAPLFAWHLRHFRKKMVTITPCILPQSPGVPSANACFLAIWVHRWRGRKVHLLDSVHAYNVWVRSETHGRTFAVVCVAFASLSKKNGDFCSRCPISKCVHLAIWVHRWRGRKVHLLDSVHAYNVWVRSETHGQTFAVACVAFASLLKKNRDFRSASCHNRSICLLHARGVWTACSFFCWCGEYVIGVLCFWCIASSEACTIQQVGEHRNGRSQPLRAAF